MDELSKGKIKNIKELLIALKQAVETEKLINELKPIILIVGVASIVLDIIKNDK